MQGHGPPTIQERALPSAYNANATSKPTVAAELAVALEQEMGQVQALAQAWAPAQSLAQPLVSCVRAPAPWSDQIDAPGSGRPLIPSPPMLLLAPMARAAQSASGRSPRRPRPGGARGFPLRLCRWFQVWRGRLKDFASATWPPQV